MCWWIKKEKPKPEIELLSMQSEQVKSEMGLRRLLYPCLLDEGQRYYYTTAKDWAEIFSWIYFDFKMPSYISARMDCEDFAFLLKGLVSAFFGLNYFGWTVGTIPGGYHGFNLFRTEDGLLLFEPQTGEMFQIGEQGYRPEYVLL